MKKWCMMRLFRLGKIKISKEIFYKMVIESYLCLRMTNVSITWVKQINS